MRTTHFSLSGILGLIFLCRNASLCSGINLFVGLPHLEVIYDLYTL
jgi:hypothetical protein